MNPKTHHIKKQVLDFQFSTKPSASEWQKNFAFKYQDELENTLTSVFDLYDDKNFYQIEKIELDLGEISEEEMISKLRTELYLELEKLLKTLQASRKKKVKDLAEKKDSGGIMKEGKSELIREFTFFLIYGALAWNSTVTSLVELEERLRELFSFAEISKHLRQQATLHKPWGKQRLFSQFSFEFSKGLLSSYFKPEVDILKKLGKSFANVIEKLRNEKFFPGEMKTPSAPVPGEILRWLALHSPENVNHWQREFLSWIMAQQPEKAELREKNFAFSETNDLDLSAKTVGEVEAHLYRIFRESGGASKTDLLKKEPQQPGGGVETLTEDFLKSGKNPEPEQEKKVKEGTTPLSEGRSSKDNYGDGQHSGSKQDHNDRINENEGENLQNNSRSGSSKENPVREKDHFSEEFNSKKTDPFEIRKPEPGSPSGELETFSLRDWKEDPVESSISGSDEIDATNAEDLFPSLNEIYINFAGQVLIWPYLVHLLKKLEIIDETRKFRSVEEQERAVVLLGYVATGNPQCEEHQLVVSKLLCGWSLHKPLVKELVLRDYEKKEADVMLENLIGNWRILQNTSIEGLRETFFWREGKLMEQEDNWKLLVEQKGVDILLDYLPYTISVIKIPWVKKAIMVDWA